MGLITGLFTWPVAPVRGVAWIADQVLDEAERQWADLADVDEKRRSGELSEEEAEELEEELVARLIHDQGGPHG
jgi:gas vesicle protein GvpG